MSTPVQPGAVIAARYRLEALIGSGGQGSIFAASDLQLGRRVAVKILDAPAQRERFQYEAALVKNLSHPNTVRLLDFGADESGRAFIVYELLEGRSAEQAIVGGRLDEARVAAIASGVLKSLMEAHAAGVVHRDIKPANIFLCDFHGEQDFPKVLDFGIAKATTQRPITQVDSVVGTPQYMAPEQVAGGEVTPATDIYALGMSMAEMLSGERIVRGGSPLTIARAQLSEEATELPALVLQTSLGHIVHRAIRKDPRQRFHSAGEMLAAIAATHPVSGVSRTPATPDALALAPTGVALTKPAPIAVRGMPAKRSSSNRGVLAAVLAVLAALGIAAGAAYALIDSTSDAKTAKRRADVGKKKKATKEKKRQPDAPKPLPPRTHAAVGWWGSHAVVARADGDATDDVIGMCENGMGDYEMCAVSGASFETLWKSGDLMAPGSIEGLFVMQKGVALVTSDGVVKTHAFATGKLLGSIQTFMSPREICAPSEHPDAVWLFNGFEDKNVLVDAVAKTTRDEKRPRSCPTEMGTYGPDECAGSPGTGRCLYVAQPNKIAGMTMHKIFFTSGEGAALGFRSDGPAYDMIAGYEVLSGFKARTRWSRPFNDGDPREAPSRNSQGFARTRERSIGISGGRIVAVSASSVAAFDLETGKTLWRNARKEEDGVIARPDRIYALSGRGLTILDASTGTLLGRIGD